MYDTPAELLDAIDAGEDSLLEFKEVTARGNRFELTGEGQATNWIARQLSAFTNADGGALVFGVRDDGRIVGVPRDKLDQLQQLIVSVAADRLEPPVDHLISTDAIQVPSGDAEVTLLKVDIRPDYYAVHAPKDRRPYVRVANTTREISMGGLARLLSRRDALLSADERPVLQASRSDLDMDALAMYHQRRFNRPAENLNRFAENMKLMVTDDRLQSHPSVAGMLLFGVRTEWHEPFAFQIIVYRGTEPDTDDRLDSRSFVGTIQHQITSAMAYLRSSAVISVGTAKSGLGRKDSPNYSERALQEAIVNALAHRDYAIAGPVRLQAFSDRITLTNPGRLPNSLEPADLFAGAQPVRRNQVIVGFLTQEATWPPGQWVMDGSGEGFLTIVRETERISSQRPTISQQTEAFSLTIPSAGA